MIFEIFIILQLYVSSSAQEDVENIEPGQCLSRFDYDYRVMQKQLELESTIRELKKQVDTCQGRSEEQLELESTVRELKRRFDRFRDQSAVSFMASLAHSIQDPQPGTTVVFDSVLTNTGQAYNSYTGVFVARVSGTFNFQLTATSSTKSTSEHLHLYIMRNQDIVGYLFLDQNENFWLIRSTAAVILLNPGGPCFRQN